MIHSPVIHLAISRLQTLLPDRVQEIQERRSLLAGLLESWDGNTGDLVERLRETLWESSDFVSGPDLRQVLNVVRAVRHPDSPEAVVLWGSPRPGSVQIARAVVYGELHMLRQWGEAAGKEMENAADYHEKIVGGAQAALQCAATTLGEGDPLHGYLVTSVLSHFEAQTVGPEQALIYLEETLTALNARFPLR